MMSPVAPGSVEGMSGTSRSRQELRRQRRERRLLLLGGIAALLGLLAAAALVVGTGGGARGAPSDGGLGTSVVSSR
jgi:hypothetical protein